MLGKLMKINAKSGLCSRTVHPLSLSILLDLPSRGSEPRLLATLTGTPTIFQVNLVSYFSIFSCFPKVHCYVRFV